MKGEVKKDQSWMFPLYSEEGIVWTRIGFELPKSKPTTSTLLLFPFVRDIAYMVSCVVQIPYSEWGKAPGNMIAHMSW